MLHYMLIQLLLLLLEFLFLFSEFLKIRDFSCHHRRLNIHTDFEMTIFLCICYFSINSVLSCG